MRCKDLAYCALKAKHEGACIVRPQPGFQTRFCASNASLLIAGSAAGVGKTAAIIMAPLRWIEVPGFEALIVRKREKDLNLPGGLVAETKKLYPAFGGDYLEAERIWRFASGATIQLSHVNAKTYETDFQGAQACYLGFDELTHFTLSEFRYLYSRNRSTCGAPILCRATCNPDPDSWVRKLIAYWLDEEMGERPSPVLPLDDRVRSRRYFVARHGKFQYGSTPGEVLTLVPHASPGEVQSMEFLPGQLQDNVYLDAGYRGHLHGLDEDLAARLLLGDWGARRPGIGTFQPQWFDGKIVAAAPAGTRWLRIWDLASTATTERRQAAMYSYTAGLLMGVGPDSRVYIRHLVLGQWDDGDVELRVQATAGKIPIEQVPQSGAEMGCDVPEDPDGPDVPLWFCRERAGAGKAQLGHYVRLLQGYQVSGAPETGDKEVRQAALKAQAKAGNVYLVRGAYIDTFLRHLCRSGRPDDVKDCASAGYEQLAVARTTGEDYAREYGEGRALAQGMGESLNVSGAWGLSSW